MKKALCATFATLCLCLSGYGKGDLKQQLVGRWQRVVGGSAAMQACEYQNWYEFYDDTTYTIYLACANLTETGALHVNAESKTISMSSSSLPFPLVYHVVSVSKKKLVLRFDKLIYKYKKSW